MMRGGGVGAEVGIGSGGEVFCSIRFLASIDHGGLRRPTATTGPKSADMLGNRLVSLELEKVSLLISSR